MRRQNDGGALGVYATQELPHRAADFDVHAGGRLVEDQQARFVHQRPCDHEATLHPAGQAACNRIAPVPELQLLEIFLRALFRQRARNAVKARLIDHNGERRFEHVEIDFLRHQTDAGFRRFQILVDVVSEYLDHATGLVDQGSGDADGGGLAGAVGT